MWTIRTVSGIYDIHRIVTVFYSVFQMPNVTWREGSFMENIKGWQSGWFYITEPCNTNWVAAPEF